LRKSLKQNLIAGLVAILPVALTVIIIAWLFNFFAKPGIRLIKIFLPGEDIPDFIPEVMGFLLTLLAIYILGLVVRNVLGKQFFNLFEKIFSNIPIVNTIYKTIKQITTTLSHPDSQAFQKVVIAEYPRKDLWTIMMVTGASIDKQDNEYYHVFVPTTPNPTSGFMLLVRKTDVIETSLSIEDGLKIVISGGVIAPPRNEIDNPELLSNTEEQKSSENPES